MVSTVLSDRRVSHLDPSHEVKQETIFSVLLHTQCKCFLHTWRDANEHFGRDLKRLLCKRSFVYIRLRVR